jgi:hypothetical protein
MSFFSDGFTWDMHPDPKSVETEVPCLKTNSVGILILVC